MTLYPKQNRNCLICSASGLRHHDIVLASPIILYDYPQIAPESVGDFFDATEIDELLTLRIMTLTDAEKNEMRNSDERLRELLARTEATAREQLTRTHGALRSLHPASAGARGGDSRHRTKENQDEAA